ncbi:MAG TPA: polyprenyl diphosphate synthase [Spirochaetota bacterium]|nr:polyprenyl diphosphate synthase [Spirochaetota bacterium]HPN82669.1 polyprenyl diphosphate synthase [Spirochaetota bacterium]
MKIADIELDDERFPDHVGIIMDGNGRWAKARGYSRNRGHRAGMQALKKFLTLVQKTPVKAVTLFCFSRENWKRSQEELDGLFHLLRQFYKSEFPTLKKRRVRVLHSGDTGGLPEDIIQIFRVMAEETASNQGKILNLAMNYSGRDEIVRACRRLMERGYSPEILDEGNFREGLDHPWLSDVDLVIRTSGELRISNFCLWQSAYAELWFTERFWPDFADRDFAEAVQAFQKRERRFGAAGEGGCHA